MTYHLSLIGELDMATADTLRQRLQNVEANAREVLIDCSDLAFIDSTGVGVLLEGRDMLARQGQGLALVHLRPELYELLELLGVTELLQVRG